MWPPSVPFVLADEAVGGRDRTTGRRWADWPRGESTGTAQKQGDTRVSSCAGRRIHCGFVYRSCGSLRRRMKTSFLYLPSRRRQKWSLTVALILITPQSSQLTSTQPQLSSFYLQKWVICISPVLCFLVVILLILFLYFQQSVFRMDSKSSLICGLTHAGFQTSQSWYFWT